jgi:putative nucleotidyltransferase with HDIG domain
MGTKHILLATADIQTAVDVSQALGADWTTTCVTSEAEALARLEAGSFAAFLVDFNLGDPDASELLNQAEEKCPDVTRLLFACEADLALVAAKVSGDHEILPKPIEPASLKSRIENGLKDLEPRPAAPAQSAKNNGADDEHVHVYAEVLQALASSTVSCRQIGALIARDASLAKELLHLTRSTYLGLPGNITNPVEAVEVLGLETVKALVMARRFLAEHGHLNSVYLSLDKIWQHSINVAQIARDLVLFETRNRALASQALAAGLLHDLGKIVLATNFEDLYGRVHSLARKQPVAMWEIEKEMFGASHGEIGACLLGMWNMSSDIVDAAAFHHEPPLNEHTQLTPLAAVHIANVLEYQRQPDSELRVLPVVSTPFLNQLKLLQRLPIWHATFAKPSSRRKASGDTETIVSPAQEAGPILQDGEQADNSFAASWTASQTSQVEASRVTSTATHIPLKAWIYTGIVAGLMMLLVVSLNRGSRSSEREHVHARTLAAEQTVVANAPAPEVEPTPAVTLPTVETSVAPTPEPPSTVSEPVLELAEAPAAEEVEPAAAAVIAPMPVETAKPAEPAPTVFKLNGIFYSATDPTAIVNGKSVQVGERVNGAKVIKITRADVILEVDGQWKVIALPTSR